MGISMSSPTNIYGVNMSVVHNMSRPESVHEKKSKSSFHYSVYESVTMGESSERHTACSEN